MSSIDGSVKSKKPKGKANGFLRFMLQFKATEERNGNSMNMKEAQDEAGKIWEVRKATI